MRYVAPLMLLWCTGCSLLVDFDAQCDMDPPDCRRDFCKSTPGCAPQPCSRDIMYFDSPPASDCSEDSRCYVSKDNNSDCLPSSLIPENEEMYYNNPCDKRYINNNQYLKLCPYGSVCISSTGNEFCLPFCNTDTHASCPNGGKCHYARGPESDFDICLLDEACNPVDGSGCPQAGMKCYLFAITLDDVTTVCIPPGQVEGHQPCEAFWDCQPGYYCWMDGQSAIGGTCLQMCDSAHSCTNRQEECSKVFNDLGICIPGVQPVSRTF